MLRNKTAIVTGSSRGLGREIAICLAKNGANLVLHYNKSIREVSEVKKIIDNIGREAIIIKADLTNYKAIENIFKTANKKFKKLDILINNVGNFIFKDIKEISHEEWRYIIDTTLNSTYLCCRACLPYMRQNNYGRIINIGDSEGDKLSASPKMCPYKIGKVGVTLLTKSLALSEVESNITVNQVSPGIMPNSVFKPESNKIPMRRYTKFEDVTNVILYLLRPESDYITGANILVAGGWNL